MVLFLLNLCLPFAFPQGWGVALGHEAGGTILGGSGIAAPSRPALPLRAPRPTLQAFLDVDKQSCSVIHMQDKAVI